MKPSESVVQNHLRAVGARWRWRYLLLLCAGGLVLTSVLALVFGAALWRGWIAQPWIAIVLGVVLLGFVGLMFLLILVLPTARTLESRLLAGASEQANPPLMDRLNTIAFLENRTAARTTASFLERIRHQTAQVLEAPVSWPFPKMFAWLSVFLAGALFLGTTWFYVHWKPWNKLGEFHFSGASAKPETSFELAPASSAEVKSTTPWGEVRITEPARDLKLTKVDVLELKIEAAANQDLQTVNWSHSVNGGKVGQHPLAEPKEPNYAAYNTELFLDELRLSDWDVVTYYAEGAAKGVDRFSSEIYFIEIRPFRSDLAKMPGGEGGSANKAMQDLSGLIERQQQILRQTRRYLGTTYPEKKLAVQDRGKLGDAESGLRQSTDSMYAKVATELENQPVGDVLEALATGSEAMQRATGAIEEDAVSSGQQQETSALQALVASRKNLQKFISENPEAFDKKDPEKAADSDPIEALAQVTEIRDRQKAARQGVDELAKEQKELRDRLEEESSGERKKSKSEQKALNEKLEDLRKKNPELFRGARAEAQAAAAAMKKAEESLQETYGGMYPLNRAVDRLQDLQQAMAKHDSARALEEALRIKQLVERQSQQLQKVAEGELSPEQTGKLAQAAQSATQQLREFADKSTPGFGPELKKTLGAEEKAGLEKQLKELGSSGTDGNQKQAAGKAAGSLKKIAEAFDHSMPQTSPGGPKPGGPRQEKAGDDPLSRALQQMQSLVRRGEEGRAAKPEDEANQKAEALGNLKAGIEELSDEPAKVALLSQAEEELKAGRPVNTAELKKLLDAIEHFRVELSEHKQREQLKAEVTHSDADRVSPLYRERVKEYFRKLSEE